MSPARRLGTVVTTLGLLGMVSSGCAVNRGAGSGNDPIAQKVDSYLVEPGVISHEITDENVADCGRNLKYSVATETSLMPGAGYIRQ